MASHIERVVARIAPRQYGLVTRAQLLDEHVPARTIDGYLAAEHLERIHASVYGVPGSPDSWLKRVCAATFGAGGAGAGRTAAGVFELLGVPDDPIEVLVPIRANPKPDGFVVHRTRRPFEVVVVYGIRVTSVVRTLEDLALSLPLRTLDELMDKALYRKLATLDELRLARGRVSKLARERNGAPVESVLETRFLRILREGGLPLPVPQFEIRAGGVLIARVDFVYPAERIAIEIESFQYHSGRRPFDRGYARFKQVQGAGYLVVPFTATDLTRPKQVVATVRRHLWERGHPDVVQL